VRTVPGNTQWEVALCARSPGEAEGIASCIYRGDVMKPYRNLIAPFCCNVNCFLPKPLEPGKGGRKPKSKAYRPRGTIPSVGSMISTGDRRGGTSFALQPVAETYPESQVRCGCLLYSAKASALKLIRGRHWGLHALPPAQRPHQTGIGSGQRECELMFVGEGPGADEDANASLRRRRVSFDQHDLRVGIKARMFTLPTC